MTYIDENREIWDMRSENDDIWSIPVTSEMVQRAREGVWSIVLTPTKPVPADWFPEDLGGSGEGYKIAFMVLLRNNKGIKVYNYGNRETWDAKLVKSKRGGK